MHPHVHMVHTTLTLSTYQILLTTHWLHMWIPERCTWNRLLENTRVQKEGMIIPHTTDHTMLHTYKALSLWYYNHWSQQQCWLQSPHSIPVLDLSHWLPAVSHSDLLTKWCLFQDQLVDSFFFVCSCRSLCMLSKILCFPPVIVDSNLKLQWSQ